MMNCCIWILIKKSTKQRTLCLGCTKKENL